jgi:putative oxidoreductase
MSSEQVQDVKRISILVASVLLAAVFLFAGGSKLLGAEMQVESFARWGYPQWFRVLTGFIEVTCAVALWVPKARGIAALALAGTMLGAIYTHVAHGEAAMIGIPFSLLVVSGALAYAWRHETLTLVDRPFAFQH